MSKSNAFEHDWLMLIFNGIPIPGLAKNDTTSPLTSLVVALHTASPGEAGNQSTNEISYTGYARILITRQGGSGWVITGSNVSPASNINFGKMTGGIGGVATHASIGTGVSDYMLYHGTVSPTITVVAGKIPRLTPSSVLTED